MVINGIVIKKKIKLKYIPYIHKMIYITYRIMIYCVYNKDIHNLLHKHIYLYMKILSMYLVIGPEIDHRAMRSSATTLKAGLSPTSPKWL